MRHYFFLLFKFCCVLPSPPLIPSCFVQLRDGSNLRAGIRSAWRRQSNTRRRLRIGTILWTHGLSPSIASGRSLLPSSCAILKLKEKRVSVRFVSIDFLIYTFFFNFFYKCFSLAKMMTKFNKDLYAKMRMKKEKPLSNNGKRTVCVTGKGPSVTPPASFTPIVFGTETARMASLATSVEEIPTPTSKKP